MVEWNPLWISWGCLALIGGAIAVFSVWSLRIRRRQEGLAADLLNMRHVVEDLISIHERDFANVRAELGLNRPQVKRPVIPADSGSRTSTEKRKHVWNLAAKGLSAQEITRRMNMPNGQVELLLNMRSYRENVGA